MALVIGAHWTQTGDTIPFTLSHHTGPHHPHPEVASGNRASVGLSHPSHLLQLLGPTAGGDTGVLPEANARPGGTVGQTMLPAGDSTVAAVQRRRQEQGLLSTRGPKPKTQGDQETCDLPCFTRGDPDECKSAE